MATSINAQLCRMAKSRDPYKESPLGEVKEGAWADVLVYNKNPLEDIEVVVEHKKHLKLIIKGGKIYKNEL
jgi:imidazolonepropionase-like amidohydrolase